MKQKLLILFLAISMVFCSSCNQREPYTVEYPELYTPEYCYVSYVAEDTDKNLLPLHVAENYICITVNGLSHRYGAIKDIPLDKYFYDVQCAIVLVTPYMHIARHKNVEEEPILDYHYTKVELLWERARPEFSDPDFWSVGEAVIYETIAEIDASAFQTFLLASINGGHYHESDFEIPATSVLQKITDKYGISTNLYLKIRVHFLEYENLVWDAKIQYADGSYYLLFFLLTKADDPLNKIGEDYYRAVYIPLPEDIVKLIPTETT